jgi:DNA-3-methyladenine glycosylase
MKKLTVEFYKLNDVVQIAQYILGKIIVTKFNGIVTAGSKKNSRYFNGSFFKLKSSSVI